MIAVLAPTVYSCVLLTALWGVSSALNNTFPDDFLFGTATSAFQIEGAWNVDGKGESIWDHILHTDPNFSQTGDTGDVACNSYYLYKEDVKMIKDIKSDFYRFSFSWPRILPTGQLDNINQAGIDYYNRLIDELIANGITPMATIYHWDIPQWLQDLGGWTNPVIVYYFEDFARILFSYFGDRVKIWITINEPGSIQIGYASSGKLAPSLNKSEVGWYLVGQNLLWAHARAYHLYDDHFRAQQQGMVSITIHSLWTEPKTNSTEDIAAFDRGMQYNLGFFAHPIYTKEGNYPAAVIESANKSSMEDGLFRSRLPPLSPEMVEYIKGTYDFFGFNYYSTKLVSYEENYSGGYLLKDEHLSISDDPSWPGDMMGWQKMVPWGLRRILKYIKENYNDPLIYITENGTPDDGRLNDTFRIEFHTKHLKEVLKSIHVDGVRVGAYTVWSLMDNLEWRQGFGLKFGLYNVNFTDPARPRVPKASAMFIKEVFGSRQLPPDDETDSEDPETL